MSLLLQPERLPWFVPSPVRPSRFVPLYQQHAAVNVEVDLGDIGAFGTRPKPAASDDLLWSDLQDCLSGVSIRRLGSGRAGRYKGFYLKGVGRTSLAANWANPLDHHNTGHLPPGNAIREFLTTEYLKAKGCDHVVVGAEGLLLSPLSAGFTGPSHLKLPSNAGQAISVKSAGFLRYANILWALHRLDAECAAEISPVLDLFNAWAAGCGGPTLEVAEAPERLGDWLAAAVERGWNLFHASWTVGVSWGSIENNFAIDGRFLDLESPIIVGQPLVGVILDGPRGHGTAPGHATITGLFEVLAFVLETRSALRRILELLAMHVRLAPPRSLMQELVDAVLRGIEAAISTDHWIWSSSAIAHRLVSWLDRVDLSSAGHAQVARQIRDICFANLQPGFPSVVDVPLSPHPVLLSGIGFASGPVPHLLKGAGIGRLDEAVALNEILAGLDAIEDCDTLLSRTEAAAVEIRRMVKPCKLPTPLPSPVPTASLPGEHHER